MEVESDNESNRTWRDVSPNATYISIPHRPGAARGRYRGGWLAESADKGRFQRGGSRGRIGGGATGRSKANKGDSNDVILSAVDPRGRAGGPSPGRRGRVRWAFDCTDTGARRSEGGPYNRP